MSGTHDTARPFVYIDEPHVLDLHMFMTDYYTHDVNYELLRCVLNKRRLPDNSMVNFEKCLQDKESH